MTSDEGGQSIQVILVNSILTLGEEVDFEFDISSLHTLVSDLIQAENTYDVQ